MSDAGLAELSAFKDLRMLSLDETEVTDEGLARLAGLAELRDLLVRCVAVTEAGTQRLQKSLPRCNVNDCNGWRPAPYVFRDF